LPSLIASSRRDVEGPSYPIALYAVIPLAIVLQSFVPQHFPQFSILNLPLLMTIYFSVACRSPIAATFIGTFIGLAQDALTHRPIGVNGIANALIGYLASSLGLRIDIENHLARVLICFVFTLLHSVIFLLITTRVLALEVDWSWLHELVRGVINAAVGVGLFALMDLARRRD
jgi:rod shape-determining protein MreD